MPVNKPYLFSSPRLKAIHFRDPVLRLRFPSLVLVFAVTFSTQLDSIFHNFPARIIASAGRSHVVIRVQPTERPENIRARFGIERFPAHRRSGCGRISFFSSRCCGHGGTPDPDRRCKKSEPGKGTMVSSPVKVFAGSSASLKEYWLGSAHRK